MDYDQARRQAAAHIDAYNRRDMDAYMAQFHEEITHQSAYADTRLGQEDGRIDGKQAFGEYVSWLLEQDPAGRMPRGGLHRAEGVCLRDAPGA